MELSELAQTRLIVLTVLLALAAAWYLSRRTDRQRLARFQSLAQAMGTVAESADEFLFRFTVEIDTRAVEVAYRHLGRPGAQGWYLETSLPLRGIPDTHCVDIRPRFSLLRRDELRSADFDRQFALRDAGLPMPAHWLREPVRAAICAFFNGELDLEWLSIDAARLRHRTCLPLTALDARRLGDLLRRQVAVAIEIEKSSAPLGHW